MPDTGAPWNIPYVENADLVRDWPADSLAVANAVAAGLTAAGNPGIGPNVVQTVKTDVFSTTSATFVAVTGTDVTITPTSDDSKVLLVGLITYGYSGNTNFQSSAHVLLTGGNLDYRGDAAGVRKQSTAFSGIFLQDFLHSNRMAYAATCAVVDSPATTDPVTYRWEAAAGPGATAFINQGGDDVNNAGNGRTVTSLVAIEVAA